MSDPGITYWNKTEINNVREHNDPITNIWTIIIENWIATEQELNQIEIEIKLKLKDLA